MDLVPLLLVLASALPLLLAVRVVPEAQRLVVLRLGRLYAVLGPGLHWVLPGIDRAIRVDLDRALPDWHSLSEADLQARLRQLARRGQLPTSR